MTDDNESPVIGTRQGTGAVQMSMSSIEALASAWAGIAEEVAFPSDNEGTSSPEAHRAAEALREADDPNARSYTHEEVMQAIQERIERARDKPC